MRSTTTTLAAVAVLLVVTLGVANWVLDPGRPGRWMMIILVLPLLWGYVEAVQVRGPEPDTGSAIMDFHRAVIAGSGLFIAWGLAIRLGATTDTLGPGLTEALLRARGCVAGLAWALLGNYLPKLLSPWSVEEQPFEWQRVHRFAGWVIVAAGLVVAGAWLTLPVADARVAAKAALGGAFLLAVGRKAISVFVSSRRAAPARL